MTIPRWADDATIPQWARGELDESEADAAVAEKALDSSDRGRAVTGGKAAARAIGHVKERQRQRKGALKLGPLPPPGPLLRKIPLPPERSG